MNRKEPDPSLLPNPAESAHAGRGQRVSAQSPYLRGDGAASAYLGLKDPKGRTFRDWADKVGLPYLLLGRVRVYCRQDIDRAWEREAHNIVGFLVAR